MKKFVILMTMFAAIALSGCGEKRYDNTTYKYMVTHINAYVSASPDNYCVTQYYLQVYTADGRFVKSYILDNYER
jgi:hypothetical protein